MRIPALLEACKTHAMPAVAITDYDNMFGSLEFSGAAMKAGVQPIIGTTLSIKPLIEGSRGHSKTRPDELLLLAKDDTGYQNLMKLSSLAYTEPEENEAPLLTYDTVCAHSEGLIALAAGCYGGVGKALLNGRASDAETLLQQLQNAFDEQPEFKKAFLHLTPGKQRGYIIFFSAPKKAETRIARIKKYTQQILDGYGFHDLYRLKK